MSNQTHNQTSNYSYSALSSNNYTSNNNSLVKGSGINYFNNQHRGFNQFTNTITQNSPTMVAIASTYIVNGNAIMSPHFG